MPRHDKTHEKGRILCDASSIESDLSLIRLGKILAKIGVFISFIAALFAFIAGVAFAAEGGIGALIIAPLIPIGALTAYGILCACHWHLEHIMCDHLDD